MSAALPVYDDPSYVALHDPFARPLHFVGLELVITACFAITVTHAVSRYRQGERYHAFQWLVIFAYGVAMELLAFNYYQNYEHGTFAVQLYHGKLPLYVTFLYVVFHYTGIKLVERLRLGVLPEALLAGLAICALDVPFDSLGVDAGWWRWSAADATLAVRWLGVPVTSYYWYMLFGAILTGSCRLLRRRVEPLGLPAMAALAPLVAVGVIVLGVVAFLPFHGLKALGVGDGTIVAAHMAACGGLALGVRAPNATRAPWEIVGVVVALHAWHLVVLAVLWRHGRATEAPLKLVAIVSAALVSAILAWGLPVSRAMRVPVPT